MFELLNFGTDSGSAANTLKVYDPTPLQAHLETIGIGMNDINFFTWEALPGRSYGRFLVYESQWKKAFPGGVTESTVALRISWYTPSGSLVQKLFTNLVLTGSAFLMSPNQETTVEAPPDENGNPQEPINRGQDGERLMVVELEHNLGHSKGHVLISEAKEFVDITQLFTGSELLQTPNLFNVYTVPSIPKADYIAYIASTHFLTAFIPAGGGAPKLTNELFTYPEPYANPLLYNKVVTRKTPPEVKFVLQSDDLCKNQFFESDPMLLDYSNEEGYFYKSPVRANTKVEGIKVLIPYAMVDHRKIEFEPLFGKAEANRFRDKITYYAQKRLLREVDMVYQGLVEGEPSQDVQSITYYFQESNGGLRTHLRTIPWEVTNAILAPRIVTCKDNIFRATLLSDMTNPGQGNPTATAVITKILNKQFLIDRQAEIADPLRLWVGLKAGARVYVYRECTSCAYVIIQGECPPTSPPQPEPLGKCCVTFEIENDGTTGYCYRVTKKTCDSLGGTWVEGGYCPDPPYCET